jgi:hypothetical protein
MKKINFFNNGNILYHTTDTVIPKVGEIVSINSNSAAAPTTYTSTNYVVEKVSHNFRLNVTEPDPKYTESDEVDVVIVGIPQPVVTS